MKPYDSTRDIAPETGSLHAINNTMEVHDVAGDLMKH